MKIKQRALAVATVSAVSEVYSKLGSAIKTASILSATILTLGLLATTAEAAVFTVTSSANSGPGTLRQAIIDANNTAGDDEIVFSPTVTNSSQPSITLNSEITVTSVITINGPQSVPLSLNGSLTNRIFNVAGGNLTVTNMTLFGGRSTTNGGAVILSSGTLTLLRTTFWNNSATGSGGSIYVQNGDLTATDSTIYGNSAGFGGGIFLSTGHVTLVRCTVTNNSGNGLAATTTTNFQLRSTLVGGNTPFDIGGTVSSEGYNLISNTTGATMTGNTVGNILNQAPQLGSFGFYGGPTYSIPPMRTSPAVDAGDPAFIGQTDGRLAVRGDDGNQNGMAGSDIGAMELISADIDADGDGSSDLAVTRGSGNSLVWYRGRFVQLSRPDAGNRPVFNSLRIDIFGLTEDISVPADFDGDGVMDPAVFRPSTGDWYYLGSSVGVRQINWGLAGDKPLAADFDGDGKADFGIFRDGTWFIFNSTLGYTGSFQLGGPGYFPAPADFDGDLKTDPAVFFNGTWIVLKSTGGQESFSFGSPGDMPVAGDYDGDNIAEAAVFRPGNGNWFIRQQNGSSYNQVQFGLGTDKPVPADYDGDGKRDIAVWRANSGTGRGEWFILQTRDGFTLANFGLETDSPLAEVRTLP